VEILYFQGCPNHEATLELVERVANELHIDLVIERVGVPDNEIATRLRFLGSPTVRIDGRDVEPGAEERTDFSLSCRVYRSDQGVAGQPDEAWIRAAMAEAAQ
jgi:hypothetical protein